jgi:hypothetical protein
MWKEVAMAQFKVLSWHLPRGKPLKTSVMIVKLQADFNLGLQEYEAVLTTQP